jgi:hypothetical protein
MEQIMEDKNAREKSSVSPRTVLIVGFVRLLVGLFFGYLWGRANPAPQVNQEGSERCLPKPDSKAVVSGLGTHFAATPILS